MPFDLLNKGGVIFNVFVLFGELRNPVFRKHANDNWIVYTGVKVPNLAITIVLII